MTALVFAVLAVALSTHTAAMWATNGSTPGGSSPLHRKVRWVLFYGFIAAAVVFAAVDR